MRMVKPDFEPAFGSASDPLLLQLVLDWDWTAVGAGIGREGRAGRGRRERARVSLRRGAVLQLSVDLYADGSNKGTRGGAIGSLMGFVGRRPNRMGPR